MFNVTKSDYHIKHNIKHYEAGFTPKAITLSELRKSAFSPTVYRKPTTEELRDMFLRSGLKKHLSDDALEKYAQQRTSMHTKGYRAYKYVIGLLDSGFVDIDGIDSTIATNAKIPTIQNVHEAMKAKNLHHNVFQSSSASPGKLRLLYKRGFMLYYPGTYDPVTDRWSLTAPTSKRIMTTNEGLLPTQDIKTTSMVKIIEAVLKQELLYIREILYGAGINTSGIDVSSARAHMHSAHCIKPGVVYEEPMGSTGSVI